MSHLLFHKSFIVSPLRRIHYLFSQWYDSRGQTLQHTATARCDTLLQHIATHCCSTLQHTATHCERASKHTFSARCSTLQHPATHCRKLPHNATHCNTLQRTATCCNTLQRTAGARLDNLALTATHCNTLQHTATHCNTELGHNSIIRDGTTVIVSLVQPNPVFVDKGVLQCVAVCCSAL